MADTIAALIAQMQAQGANRFLAKKLAPNDNSKNQPYLGDDFSVLNLLPHGEVTVDYGDIAGSKRDRAKAALRFFWIDDQGLAEAPAAKFILYPKYPEVRLSGFLKGCRRAPNEVMTSRAGGRVLFLGVTEDGRILAHAVFAESPLAVELHARVGLEQQGVFLSLPATPGLEDTKARLLEVLAAIYRKHWIQSQKLGKDGIKHPYVAGNGGGYTLEAELGITPNGYSEPDYLGWEVKQYGVADFTKFVPKSPVTLMTPEPTGGLYREQGVVAFMARYAYPDKYGKPDRMNFGGIYACGRDFHADTGLRLALSGYDSETGKITDMTGGIVLENREGEQAAIWRFGGIMEHWNRKHAKAAYVPSLFHTPQPEYRYGPKVLLCEQTDFTLLLKAVAAGHVYYDPGIKVEGATSAKPAIKRRSQFRVKHDVIDKVYKSTGVASLI
jgi:MvaI/BcnI restriction endonuclease family